MEMSKDNAPITAVYTGIGRGHPNYLDSVLRTMRQHHPEEFRKIQLINVPDVSRGLSKLAWKGVGYIYRLGARGGSVSLGYTRLRTRHAGYDARSLSARLLGRDLRAALDGYTGICLVAHPLLAVILASDHRVFYLHGEIAAPRESAIRGLERIYVPLAETRDKMVARAVEASSIRVTGLVLEPELPDGLEQVVVQRRDRIASGRPLTIGFFISGAYPPGHIALMTLAAQSCLEAGHRVRFFWGSNQRAAARLTASVRRFCEDVLIDDSTAAAPPDRQCVIVTAPSREQETVRSMTYLPGLDLFCAAPHERINWAAGAGLPIVMIGPPIGSFAPENRGCVLRTRCGIEFTTPNAFRNFAQEIQGLLTTGKLLEMVDAGIGTVPIDGARKITDDLIHEIA